MKILISSHAFAPSIGGIETVSALLAEEFVRLGHEVTVVTQTPDESAARFSYPVIRQPSIGELRRVIKWCDLFWHSNLSLRTLWPALFLRKPVVITHHGSYCRSPQGIDLLQRLKHAIVQRTTSVAISRAVAACFETDSVIIPSPYDARKFVDCSPGAERSGDLIFLGRLVSEKGIDLLLQALALLRSRTLSPRLTIVGSGPELSAMQQMAAQLGLGDQVTFAGPKRGAELVNLLQGHKILVIPSRYDEPFGVVALEGIACGCIAVGSSGGGLPEAIGPCGLTFPNGDVEALVLALEKLLRIPDERRRLVVRASEHLARFHSDGGRRGLPGSLSRKTPVILLSHPTANQNVRQTALAFAEAGLLEEFWTCVNWKAGGLLDRCFSFLPRFQGELRRRSFPAELASFYPNASRPGMGPSVCGATRLASADVA